MEEIRRRQALLQDGFFRHRALRFGRHHPFSTLIEGLITRSDRRAADLLEAAWRRGARFDGWDEWRNETAWEQAIEETGASVEDALRARGPSERLPWDHIDVLVSKAWLRNDWQAALELRHAPDCRGGECRNCGLNETERDLCRRMWMRAAEAGLESSGAVPAPSEPHVERQEPPAVQRLRFRIGRSGEARFLSNRELMTAWSRALRRAAFPLSYSQGFHAHPKITFSSAPALGEESECDYMDVVLRTPVSAAEALQRLAAALPAGMHVFDSDVVPLNAPSLMASVTGFSYTLVIGESLETVQARVDDVLARPRIELEREGKMTRRGVRRVSTVDVRPMIRRMAVRPGRDGALVDVEVGLVETRGVRMREILALLASEPASARVIKRATYLAEPA
ncbi:MAG TPA: TIGR03936 family radical SAM-associated protein [Candidatus Hydrogenedentes bacterium]|nr:TIGR03936 family radical SAM-associated protein [Candidatus Hydrogenedentota bacterium]